MLPVQNTSQNDFQSATEHLAILAQVCLHTLCFSTLLISGHLGQRKPKSGENIVFFFFSKLPVNVPLTSVAQPENKAHLIYVFAGDLVSPESPPHSVGTRFL